MASTQAINMMASRLPVGYTDLANVVQNGIQIHVNIIGFVADFLPPAQCKGADYQMKIVLKDNSLLPNGLEVKMFNRLKTDLPAIKNIGDIVLLRGIRIQTRAGALSGLSTFRTQHIVFPKDCIVSPDFRTSYQVHGSYIPHTKSQGAENPDIHEQQWIITLNDYCKKTHVSNTLASNRQTNPKAVGVGLPGISNFRTGHNDRLPLEAADRVVEASVDTTLKNGSNGRKSDSAARDKFSYLKDVTIDKMSRGNFYDLAGEVVKIYSNDRGYLELYLTDYTANEILTNYTMDESDISLGRRWPGPIGRRTLMIELLPPHGPWAQNNVKPGDFLSLKNVRVKYNNMDTVIGNMWPDINPDTVNVIFLDKNSIKLAEINKHKNTYMTEQKALQSSNVNSLAKTKRKKAKREHAREQQLSTSTKKVQLTGKSGQLSDLPRKAGELDVDLVVNPSPQAKRLKVFNSIDMSSRYIINKSVRCHNPTVALSSFEEIVNNPQRWYIAPNGAKFEMSFVNAKHHARLRVVDYYPHTVRDFARAIPNPLDSNNITWEWDFWLVLQSANANEQENSYINCSVRGADAATFIGVDIRPQDLSRTSSRQILSQLEERLFYLWGELKEEKDKFLHAHPHIKPDEDFSALKYNISSDNLPFEACIAEYGINGRTTADNDELHYNDQWTRVYKICDTEIES